MTEEFQLRKEVEQANRAKTVHDQCKDAIAHIHKKLHEKWESSSADDEEGRERTWRMLKSLKELDRYYLQRIETGKLAEIKLEKLVNG